VFGGQSQAGKDAGKDKLFWAMESKKTIEKRQSKDYPGGDKDVIHGNPGHGELKAIKRKECGSKQG